MTKMTSFKPAATAIGFALVGSLAVANLANAAENPFGTSAMKGGYMQLAEAGKCGGDKKKAEGKCGEGKCGAAGKASAEKKAGEAKCGGDKKAGEGKCGGDKKAGEGKCGGAK